jgi:hypothetical protein
LAIPYADKLKSPLSACYVSSAVPGVYAFLAYLISNSKTIAGRLDLEGDDRSEVTLATKFYMQFHHYSECIVEKLARQIRDHMRELLSQVVKKAEQFESRSEEASKNSKDISESDADDQETAKEEYSWLASQLRVFLFCYSLLGEFDEGKHDYDWSSKSRMKTLPWPLVCFC